MIRQGEVYLVEFGKNYKSEFGKIRPAVILQSDIFNALLLTKKYKSVLVVPLSTLDEETEYKIKIKSGDRLKKDSFIVASWICSVDLDRIMIEKGLITKLSSEELKELKEKICRLL